MKKTEFQKYGYSELSKLFLKLFMQGDLKKYSSEARGNKQKLVYIGDQGKLSIYFFKNGNIVIYQNGDYDSIENTYYEWHETSNYKDVVAALKNDLKDFIRKIEKEQCELSLGWGHDVYCDFSYENSKFKKAASVIYP